MPSPEPSRRESDRAPHPKPAALRAYVDGELRWWERRRCAGHLRACPDCRARLAEEAELERRAAELLAAVAPAVETSEGWLRLGVLAGSAAGSRLAGRRIRGARLGAAGIGLAATVAAALIGLRVAGQHTLAHGGEAELQDLCCWDLDGGGPGDDGIVTVTLPGQHVLGLTVYEDRNGSGSLTGEDPIRFASEQPGSGSPSIAPDVTDGASLELRDVCCADYDRGGASDDGVFTMSRAGVVVQVALYEDVDASHTLTEGDRVRWSSGSR